MCDAGAVFNYRIILRSKVSSATFLGRGWEEPVGQAFKKKKEEQTHVWSTKNSRPQLYHNYSQEFSVCFMNIMAVPCYHVLHRIVLFLLLFFFLLFFFFLCGFVVISWSGPELCIFDVKFRGVIF